MRDISRKRDSSAWTSSFEDRKDVAAEAASGWSLESEGGREEEEEMVVEPGAWLSSRGIWVEDSSNSDDDDDGLGWFRADASDDINCAEPSVALTGASPGGSRDVLLELFKGLQFSVLVIVIKLFSIPSWIKGVESLVIAGSTSERVSSSFFLEDLFGVAVDFFFLVIFCLFVYDAVVDAASAGGVLVFIIMLLILLNISCSKFKTTLSL